MRRKVLCALKFGDKKSIKKIFLKEKQIKNLRGSRQTVKKSKKISREVSFAALNNRALPKGKERAFKLANRDRRFEMQLAFQAYPYLLAKKVISPCLLRKVKKAL